MIHNFRSEKRREKMTADLIVKKTELNALLFRDGRVFRRVRKIARSNYLVSSFLSFRQHGTTRLPLDRFSLNLIFEYFS
jgi:hypothetical protein